MTSAVKEKTTLDLRNAILRTITYFDLFDYPPTIQEIHRNLESRASLNETLAQIAVMSDQIERQGEFCAIKGRNEIFLIRRQRRQISANLWGKSLNCLKLTQAIPYLRFVGVSGSLAVNNADEAADVDIIFISAPGKLKVSYFFLCLLKKIFKSFEFCPSLGLDISDLEVKRQHLYIAHEINQIKPIWGNAAYQKFLESNKWTIKFMPNVPIQKSGPPGLILNESPLLKTIRFFLEFILGGRFNPLGPILTDLHSWSLQRKKISCTRINCFQIKDSSNKHRHHDARIIDEYNKRIQNSGLNP